jgi:hypothetical protein
MTLWTLRNPHSLPMVIELIGAQTVRASFPAIPGCEGEATNLDPWKARDEAILNCAKSIVVNLQSE